MKLIIAEKPELARAIVTAIEGKEIRKDGYIEKGDYAVTWAFGHMLQLKDPEDYDNKYKKWSISTLPLYFKNWEHKISNKKEDEYKAKQLKVIENLLNRCDEVINGADPDAEGQYLIDEILQFYKNKKPVKRILINDNNTEYIKKAFTKLEDNKKYESLVRSAYARSVADILLGINATRLFTCLNGSSSVFSVGRVQTPLLGLIVNRDHTIDNHIKEKYYELTITANNRDKTNNIVFMYQKTKDTPVNDDKLITDISFLENIKNKIKEILLRKDEGKKGENGSIGTPATRATIIKNLFDRNYVKLIGKTIRATELGKEFYNKLPSVLQTADMTALWWDIQEDIIENKKTPDDLILSVLDTVKSVITEGKGVILSENENKCPNCDTGYLILKNGKYGLYWSCIDCEKNYKDKDGKPNFEDKNSIEKSDLKCPKDEGILYKNTGKYGDYWRCGTCKEIYKDRNGTPELIKKEIKKSGHKCKCGSDLIERVSKNTGKIFYACSKCKKMYFPQADGSLKEYIKK